ncbi:unnamed protein product [Caenorhabditis brenneri]
MCQWAIASLAPGGCVSEQPVNTWEVRPVLLNADRLIKEFEEQLFLVEAVFKMEGGQKLVKWKSFTKTHGIKEVIQDMIRKIRFHDSDGEGPKKRISKEKVVNVLKAWFDAATTIPSRPGRSALPNAARLIKEFEGQLFQVEAILKMQGEQKLYLVKWRGYTETTWEPSSSFPFKKLLIDFEKKKNAATATSTSTRSFLPGFSTFE